MIFKDGKAFSAYVRSNLHSGYITLRSEFVSWQEVDRDKCLNMQSEPNFCHDRSLKEDNGLAAWWRMPYNNHN